MDTNRIFKKCIVNGCECWNYSDLLIVKQKNANIYNAYKAVPPKNEDNQITQYCSVKKVILRVETHRDDDGKEVKANVMGAKDYLTLEAAMKACQK